jgi:hypothetical protein
MAFFYKFNPLCSIPACTAEATHFMVGTTPLCTPLSIACSFCHHHAQGQLAYLIENGYDQIDDAGSLLNTEMNANFVVAMQESHTPEDLREAYLDLVNGGGDGDGDGHPEHGGEGHGLEMDCATHGKTAWRGEVICDECKRVYRLPYGEGRSDRELLEPATGTNHCDCGARLTEGPEQSTEFTAQPICPGCFDTHKPRWVQ